MKSKLKNLILIGSGYHAKVIKDEVNRDKKYQVIGYVDDFKKDESKLESIRKIGRLINLRSLKKNHYCILAIGQGDLREKVINKIKKLKLKVKWATIISNDTIISPDVIINEGAVIISGSVISNGTIIGKHCLINTGSKIDHDNIFEDYSSCGPGVTTGGNVKIGKSSHIGIGSTIKNNLTIEKFVVIGAGSVVVKNCKKNHVYFGNPAKKIRLIKKNENYLK
jgi:sugar O-acyltransferase (sialic acid O-acetyltransferase NeuD family)